MDTMSVYIFWLSVVTHFCVIHFLLAYSASDVECICLLCLNSVGIFISMTLNDLKDSPQHLSLGSPCALALLPLRYPVRF